MNALAQILPADRGAFLFEITSDTMAPTYRRGQHAVVCQPVDRYSGEGVYLIDDELYRCQRMGGYVHCSRDNTAYKEQIWRADLFDGARLALVVADIAVRDTAWRV
jgi:phage repressor protein C with HTH and peptisase S24 domain